MTTPAIHIAATGVLPSWALESWGEHCHTAATLLQVSGFQLRRGNTHAALRSQNAATKCLRDLAQRMSDAGIEEFSTATHTAYLRRYADHIDAVVVKREPQL